MWQLLGSIPFIGKHKRVVGGVLMGAGSILEAIGVGGGIGDQLKEVGIAVTGFGLAHAGMKSRIEIKGKF